MNEHTKEILDLYDNDIKVLDISNKEIKGELDLAKFKKLGKLYCQNNEITSLCNISGYLRYINCSNNLITSLMNLDYTLKKIKFDGNPIKALHLLTFKMPI
jgi:Leucine-rich repeat (LRR) protein